MSDIFSNDRHDMFGKKSFQAIFLKYVFINPINQQQQRLF